MNVVVVGASGATGRLLVDQLLAKGHTVKVVVRTKINIPEQVLQHENLTVMKASILELNQDNLGELLQGVQAIACCLGHNLSFEGMFLPPRRLVTESVRRLCEAAKASDNEKPMKFVLMNTTGVRNRDLDEKISFGQKIVIGMLRALLPPHADNEDAADYLRSQLGQYNKDIEWTAVRPDGLIDREKVTHYDLHESPTRSAIFDAGETSRINVAHFMASLISEEALWMQWKGRMPVIYDG